MDTATTIFNFSVEVGGIGLIILICGWLIVVVLNGFKKGPFNIKQAGPATRVGFGITLLGIAAVVLAVLSVMLAGAVWTWQLLSNLLTPASLALSSIAIGILPLLLSGLGVVLAKISGGSVDARGPQNCSVWGVQLGGLVYTLFISYWLMLFTVGLMVLGLIISAVWAVI